MKKCRQAMKRIFDLLLACMFVIILIIPVVFVVIAIKLSSDGPVLFRSDRVGLSNHLFEMFMFWLQRGVGAHEGTSAARPSQTKTLVPMMK